MSAKKLSDNFRTWVEIDARAARHNYDTFRGLTGKRTQLWAVVKSNAYGHGLFAFSGLMDRFGVDGLCVDSIVEGVALRRSGIKKPILVLGATLPGRLDDAAEYDITVSVSNFEALRALVAFARRKAAMGSGSGPQGVSRKAFPRFHIKIDTGMHRQGFYVEDLPRAIRIIHDKRSPIKFGLTGIFTHFASAKDLNYPGYTDAQFEKFMEASRMFAHAGFARLVHHAAATGGTLIGKKYHLDAVRVGIGMYGLWPSKELEVQLGDRIELAPVLSWRAVVSETKKLAKGDYVGYDLTERVSRPMTLGILPVGYWHGFPRALSSAGSVIVGGGRAKVIGRVSMDMTAIGMAARAPSMKPGDIATLIGKDRKEEIAAWEIAQVAGTSHYEFLTRLNPLMERVIVGGGHGKR